MVGRREDVDRDASPVAEAHRPMHERVGNDGRWGFIEPVEEAFERRFHSGVHGLEEPGPVNGSTVLQGDDVGSGLQADARGAGYPEPLLGDNTGGRHAVTGGEDAELV